LPETCSFPPHPALCQPTATAWHQAFQPSSSSSSLVLSVVPPDHLPMQSLSASMRASWWEHLLHTCPPSSLCRGLGCSLRWPSTMGRARDSPGRCSTDLLAGCPLHPGDSALGP
ncbi:hypothetical protein E2320_011850, partial [Naja naja]